MNGELYNTLNKISTEAADKYQRMFSEDESYRKYIFLNDSGYLFLSFAWDRTHEGKDYWFDVFNKIG